MVVQNNASFSFNPVSDFTMFPTNLSEWYGSCTIFNFAFRQFVVLAQYRYPSEPNRNAAAHDVVRSGTDTQVFFFTI